MVKSKGGVPRGYQAVMPYLRVRDAASAIKFYKKVFGAKENYRLKIAGKVGHAELDVGGAVIMISDEFPDSKAVGPETLKGTSVHLAAYVEDVDKVVAKAVKAGAKMRQNPTDQFYGDRMGQIEDPFGHVWTIQTRFENVDPKDMQKRLNAMLRGEGLPTPQRGKKAPAAKGGRKAAPAKTATARKAAGEKRGPRAPQTAAPEQAAPQKATPRKGAPQKAAPQKATPRKGAPQKATPRKGAPQKAAPQKASAPKAASKKASTRGRRKAQTPS